MPDLPISWCLALRRSHNCESTFRSSNQDFLTNEARDGGPPAPRRRPCNPSRGPGLPRRQEAARNDKIHGSCGAFCLYPAWVCAGGWTASKMFLVDRLRLGRRSGRGLWVIRVGSRQHPSRLGLIGMKNLLIVFHSLTGGTRQMAEAAADGAATEPAVTTRLLRAGEAGPEDVAGADGFLFATPENLAAMAGVMKDFFDRTYYPALDRLERPAVRVPDLRRQRRHQRGAADRSDRHRMAAARGGGAADRVHPSANARGDPGAEDDRGGRAGGVPRHRSGPGKRNGGGDFLSRRGFRRALTRRQ